MGLLREKCFRCGEKRTKKSFEGVPICDSCELKIKAEREEPRYCPIDSAKMSKDVILNVIIDRCDKCGGIWLDSGELEVMKKTIESGAESDFATGMIIGMVVG